MALASTSYFASFDITDGSQDRDISPVLQAAIYYDLHFLGNLRMAFDNPIHDVIHYWNEATLNTDTVTVSGSQTSSSTSVVLSSGHGARAHVGDELYDTTLASTEVLQITAISTDTLTVTRGFGSTTQAVIADAAVLALVRAEQEGSDIGADRTVAPTVRSNYHQIWAANDVLITGNQLARKMATNEQQDFLAQQLGDRATELKINMTRGFLYGEKSGTPSDTVYPTLGGLRYWARTASGNVNSTSGAMSWAVLNTDNKAVVDKGVFPNTLAIGTDLVGSISGIDSTNRRFRESDIRAGYTVQEVVLAQGNMVTLTVDSRVKTGDYFLFDNGRVVARPVAGRGMFLIAATDFADAKKRRVMADWTLEVRNPQAIAYGYNKT